HPVANHFAAAELGFVAIGCQITIDLNDEVGIGEPDPVARGWSVVVGVGQSVNEHAHSLFRAETPPSFHLRRGPHARRGCSHFGASQRLKAAARLPSLTLRTLLEETRLNLCHFKNSRTASTARLRTASSSSGPFTRPLRPHTSR